jgi:hypothetical protein
MKTVWIATLAIAASGSALAQSTGNTIYKHVDESGRITYTNRPMKGAVAMDLDPISTVPGLPPEAVTRAAVLSTPTGSPLPVEKPAAQAAKLEVVPKAAPPQIKVEPLPDSRSASAVSPAPAAAAKPTLAAVEPSTQRKRDEERRRILEGELKQEERGLESARASVAKEQQNPQLIAAVRAAQATAEPTPAQMAEFRSNLDKASGRIRGLQAIVADHEKNIEALKKELGALKP